MRYLIFLTQPYNPSMYYNIITVDESNFKVKKYDYRTTFS